MTQSWRDKVLLQVLRHRLLVSAVVLGLLGCVVLSYVAVTATGTIHPQYVVTQRGRAFSLEGVTIKHGEAIRIVNDDGDLRHHAYVESDEFKFDSGDQEPGSSTDVTFPVSGTFDVLCGIHPKMKLEVTVK